MRRPILIVFLVLLVDQLVKFWVKLNMNLGEEINVTDKLYELLFSPETPVQDAWGHWFIVHFTENPGMAFGLEFAGDYGKLILSLFRILAVGAITWYLFKLVRTGAHKGLIASIALILAGAMGNILDSAFYGLMFSASELYQTFDPAAHAVLFPEGGGYAGFLHGKVVDMLYFPVIDTTIPDWFPFWEGERFVFFRPVFNIADSSITVGVAMIILWQKRYFGSKKSKTDPNASESDSVLPSETGTEDPAIVDEQEATNDEAEETKNETDQPASDNP